MFAFAILSFSISGYNYTNSSGTGSGSTTGSGYSPHSKNNEPNEPNENYSCLGCKIVSIFMLILLSIALFTLFSMCTYMCLQECIVPKIKKMVQSIKRCLRRNSNNQNIIQNNYFSMFKSNTNPINSECPICLETIDKKKLFTLHCGHTFHANCMKQYINSDNYNHLCPLCRDIIVI